MIPPGVDGKRLLVIVDASWWLTMAFHLAGPSGMAPLVVGWLVTLLSDECPYAVAAALDSTGPTWRHKRTDGLTPERRYKGNREPRPQEYFAVARRILSVFEFHAIPLLWAEGFEADDVIAAAVKHAEGDGLDVAILSGDKDLCSLVRDASGLRPTRVVVWDGKERVRGECEVLEQFGVLPCQIPDFLAIVGDSSDNVRGVPGLGPAKAAAILRPFGSLGEALQTLPDPPSESAIKAAIKFRDRAKASGGDALEYAEQDLSALRHARSLAIWLTALQAAREDVLLARELVGLDASAPIAWDSDALPVGGFDVPALERAYLDLGFTALAREVPRRAKRPLKAA